MRETNPAKIFKKVDVLIKKIDKKNLSLHIYQNYSFKNNNIYEIFRK